MDKIRVGIIGFGFMGKTHTYGYKTLPFYYNNLPYKISLVGVCTPRMEVAQQAVDTLGFEFATTNPDDIINSDEIDVINICSPNVFHKDVILKALKAGKHIYCDKPLATSLKDSQEILEAMKSYKGTTQMALQYRFFPATMRAKEIIDEGRIGKVLSFRACYLHSGSVDPNKAIGWRQDANIGGGGVLFDLGSHILDLMYHFLGEYKSIFANTETMYAKRPNKQGEMVEIKSDDLAQMIVKLKSGGTGTIEASKVATGANDELRFEIHGDKGSMRFNLMEPNWLEYYDNNLADEPLGGLKGYTKIECVQRYPKPGGDFPAAKLSIGWIRAHVHSLYNFMDCVYSSRQASPSFKEGAYIQYVMEKAYESDKAGRWVELC
ncbi:MAG: Gfo/Idh/MocA family oxidoreductase [Bacillota bacterium]